MCPGSPDAEDAALTDPWKSTARPLSPQAFEAAARLLGCDLPALQAVWEVEAAGRHFLPDGSLVRRFEPHHFPAAHWPAIGFAPRPGRALWRESLAQSDDGMFRRAYAAAPAAALAATSWGAPQIMGSNHRAAGFDTPLAMVAAMAAAADAQLAAFVTLIRAWGLDGALRGHDWTAFARRYNGSGQVEVYARRMEAAYRRHSGGARSPQVLRVGDRGAAVLRLQAALGVEADGAFGPLTLAAVEAFQARAGLPVDGVVGHRTWAALLAPDGPRDPAPAPVQPTPADRVLDEVARVSGAAGAVAASIGAFRAAVPDAALVLLAGAAGLCAVVLCTAHVLRRWRG